MKPKTQEKWTARELAGKLRWLSGEMIELAGAMKFFGGFNEATTLNANRLEQAGAVVGRWSEGMIRRINGTVSVVPSPAPPPPQRGSGRVIFMVEDGFVPEIRRGIKVTTIRPVRKRPVAPGREVQLKQWLGVPYRSGSKQQWVATGVLVSATPIVIHVDGMIMNGIPVEGPEENILAQQDGFANAAALRNWFIRHYGDLPFTGTRYRWELKST